jgi:TFIIF-interacting CTD phosphatase-like protein
MCVLLPMDVLIHFTSRLQSCTQLPNGSYTKDLSLVEADLSSVCLVDNSPVSYTVNEGSRDNHLLCLIRYSHDYHLNSKWNTH